MGLGHPDRADGRTSEVLGERQGPRPDLGPRDDPVTERRRQDGELGAGDHPPGEQQVARQDRTHDLREEVVRPHPRREPEVDEVRAVQRLVRHERRVTPQPEHPPAPERVAAHHRDGRNRQIEDRPRGFRHQRVDLLCSIDVEQRVAGRASAEVAVAPFEQQGADTGPVQLSRRGPATRERRRGGRAGRRRSRS